MKKTADFLFNKGFNSGYFLAKYSPEWISVIELSLDSENIYMNGMLLGIAQFNKEAKEKRRKQFVIPDSWKKISLPEQISELMEISTIVYEKWMDKEKIKYILGISERLFLDIIKIGEIEHKSGRLRQLWNFHQILQLFGIDIKYNKQEIRSDIKSTITNKFKN